MKISEVIAILEEMKVKHGDVPVFTTYDFCTMTVHQTISEIKFDRAIVVDYSTPNLKTKSQFGVIL